MCLLLTGGRQWGCYLAGPFYLDLQVGCSSQPQAFQNRVLLSNPPAVLMQFTFPRAVFVLSLLLGCSSCQRFLCTWEVPVVATGLARPGMLGHLLSCGTGTAARQDTAEGCPHRVRLVPCRELKKAAQCCHKSGEQGGVEGMRAVGPSSAQALPSVLPCGVSWAPAAAAATSGRGCTEP